MVLPMVTAPGKILCWLRNSAMNRGQDGPVPSSVAWMAEAGQPRALILGYGAHMVDTCVGGMLEALREG